MGITIVFLLIMTQIARCSALEENSSNETERIEIGKNPKRVYYNNESVEMSVSGRVVVYYHPQTCTVFGSSTPPPPKPPDIIEILKIVKEILRSFIGYGVGCILLAWKIWNVLKGLRRGRPRDYRGILW